MIGDGAKTSASDELRDLLGRIPATAGRPVTGMRPLSANGNRVYRVELAGDCVVVRLPGRRRYIDTAAEYRNQRLAARLGLAPRVLGHDRESGAIVCAWLGDHGTPDPSGASEEWLYDAVAGRLAVLHHRTAPFADTISPARAIEWNLSGAAGRVAAIRSRADELIERLRRLPARRAVNCHGDPTPGNIILANDEPRRAVFIDWEYSHRTAAAWDLAIFCNAVNSDREQERRFRKAYNGRCRALGEPPVDAIALSLMREAAALASNAWAINQDVGDGPRRVLRPI